MMDKAWKSLAASVFGVLMLGALATGTKDVAAQEFVTFGGGSTGGAFNIISAGMARLVEKNVPGVKATARVTSATIENIRLLGQRKIEFALAAANGPHDAANGKPPFTGEKITNVRYIVAGYSSTLQVMVPKDSAIKTFADFKDKRVGVLTGITAQDWFPRIAEVYGIKGQYKEFVLRSGELESAMRDGNIDVSVNWSSAPTASISDLATAKELRFLPVLSAQAQEVIKTHPYFFEFALPKGMYRGVDADVPSMGVPILLVTHAGVSDDLVYKVTKMLFERNDELKAVHPNAADFGPQNAGKSQVIPMHPGAARYYKEKGLPMK
ncbi:MAG: TAXI family TRAP transporter solute-binding subunit [Burkholderiaceae bacterium]|nr:TAXI family TRAP transporter solute-binding subunit [Burkholderiaceae bacterium]